jgi:hypothetical protein
MLTPRFLALPAIALTVIAALSQAHSGAAMSEARPLVVRAANCALPTAAMEASCNVAGGTIAVR